MLGEHGLNPSVREKIGVVLEDGGFPSTMSAAQVSTLLARAYKNWNAEQFASYIEKFGIDREKAIKDYSKGMKTKLNIAAALSHDAELLLLDEPTNDIDVNTLRALEEVLENFAGCAVVISHDRWFLDRIATHILSFEGDSKVVFYQGSYSEFEEWKRAQGGDTTPHRVKYKKLME